MSQLVYGRGREGFDVAEICLNGHVVNESTQRAPGRNQKHCSNCGKSTITACGGCNTPIRGSFYSSGFVVMPEFEAPAFCAECGMPYPWTETRRAVARELAAEAETLDQDEKAVLMNTLDDLLQESPRTPVAVAKFKRLVKKAGGTIADGLKTVMFDIVSEAVKRQLWP